MRTNTLNKDWLLTKREVSMAGYWLSSFFSCLWTKRESRFINTQKKEEANIQPPWPRKLSHWKINYMGKEHYFPAEYIPLTNRVRGPYRKLRTEFFPLRVKIVGEKRGSVTCSTDREDEVGKIFIIPLLCVWRVRERFLSKGNDFKFWSASKAKRVNSESFLKVVTTL